jgi:hypothetical protein
MITEQQAQQLLDKHKKTLADGARWHSSAPGNLHEFWWFLGTLTLTLYQDYTTKSRKWYLY